MASPDLITLAQTLLHAGDRSNAALCLQAALANNPANLAAHNLFETSRFPDNFSDAFGVNAVVSQDDDILRFFINHPSSRHPIRDYLSDGWRSMVELMQVLERLDCRLSECRSFLEFASGFGRFTRHLKKALPDGALHVSDVVPGSVDFLRQQFGVEGFYSNTDVQQVALEPSRYEVIFVLSLFSHLPAQTWQLWLEKLFSAVRPGGVLIVSTHGEKSVSNYKVELDANGFAFFTESESQALEGQTYGCTFTSHAYVERAIQKLPEVKNVLHLPAHFWGHQDAYAIQRTN